MHEQNTEIQALLTPNLCFNYWKLCHVHGNIVEYSPHNYFDKSEDIEYRQYLTINNRCTCKYLFDSKRRQHNNDTEVKFNKQPISKINLIQQI